MIIVLTFQYLVLATDLTFISGLVHWFDFLLLVLFIELTFIFLSIPHNLKILNPICRHYLRSVLGDCMLTNPKQVVPKSWKFHILLSVLQYFLSLLIDFSILLHIKMSVLWHFSLPWSEYTFREYLILILTLVLIFRASGSDAEGCAWQADSSATQSTTQFPTALLGRLTDTAGKENCRHSKLPIASKMQIHLNILLNIILLLIFWVLIVPIILFWISLRI